MEQEATGQAVRLRGYVQVFFPDRGYGFVAVGAPQTGSRRQYHFSMINVARRLWKSLAVGMVVEFTPVPCPVPDKRDKATEIEVVG